MPQEPVLVVGTGALACLFAGRLASAGFSVIMLGSWQEALEALNKHGVRLMGDSGESVQSVRAINDPADCLDIKHALVLVKSWQTGHAAEQLTHCLSPDGVALTLQNGIGNREILADKLGAARVAQGVTTSGAMLLEPGLVRSVGERKVWLSLHSRLAFMAGALRQAGFEVEEAPDPDVLLWGKLVINAAINPLTALLGVTNGELLERPTARALMTSLVREAAAVASANGINLPYPDALSMAENTARQTAANRSSMLQDVSRGAPTEIDAICGAIVSAGGQVDVPTPVNHIMWQLVKALCSKNISNEA